MGISNLHRSDSPNSDEKFVVCLGDNLSRHTVQILQIPTYNYVVVSSVWDFGKKIGHHPR